MRTWAQLSLFVAMTALFAVGCGDDDGAQKIRLGEEGDSCTRTGDCEDGLQCINNFCSSGGNAGAGGDTDGGSGAGGSTGPALGEEGESCEARRDCAEGLQCIDQVCTSGGAAGAGGAPAPRLGSRGESCESASDCQSGLTCVPRTVGGFGAGGVCDLEDFGLEPTGKMCIGECATAADCCELPDNLAGLVQGVTSCEALGELMLGGNVAANCPVSGPAAGYETACFYYRTYCVCATPSPWTCENSLCTYTADCDPDLVSTVDTWDGCPSRSRLGNLLTTSCSEDEKCETEPACSTPDDCSFAHDLAGQVCDGDGCTCYESQCYLKCDEDLDCPAQYNCDTQDDVCKYSAACESDVQCAQRLSDATAECRDGACVIPCMTDQDCSDSGTLGGGFAFNEMVCNDDNVCETLGCSNDEDCAADQGTAVRRFCVDAAAGQAMPARSAITD